MIEKLRQTWCWVAHFPWWRLVRVEADLEYGSHMYECPICDTVFDDTPFNDIV